jgi:hypothetical protein
MRYPVIPSVLFLDHVFPNFKEIKMKYIYQLEFKILIKKLLKQLFKFKYNMQGAQGSKRV